MSPGPPQILEETFGMETTGGGSLQTSPLGDGAINGSGSLGPHRLLQHRGKQCKVACSAGFSWLQPARPLVPPALDTGDTLSFRHFVLYTPWESRSCPICGERCVLTLCRHTPLQDPSRCVCLQTHRRPFPSLTAGTEFQSCGEQHRALWERT